MTEDQMIWLGTMALLAALASYWDIRHRLLPNWLCGIALIAGLGLSFYFGGWTAAGSAISHALIALVVCMGLWAAGAIGGGDAKFYAAIAAWFPLGQGISLMLSVVLCGVILLAISMAVRRSLNGPPKDDADPHSKLPYGVAISVGACVAMITPIL